MLIVQVLVFELSGTTVSLDLTVTGCCNTMLLGSTVSKSTGTNCVSAGTMMGDRLEITMGFDKTAAYTIRELSDSAISRLSHNSTKHISTSAGTS